MKRIPIAAIIVSVCFLIALVWWKHGIIPVDEKNKEQKIFVIKPGEDTREITNNLKQEGLIQDPVVFFLLIKQLGIDNKIQAGDFRLSPSMSALDIAQTLTHGTLDVWVTIPEGKRAEEIADILKEKVKSYDPSWRKELVKNEGYLFPDTYLIPTDSSITLIISIMKNNFDNKITNINFNNTAYTKEEIVTIASLIEREAKFAQDRPLVASVILNRLRIGMKLDIDATIQYALGYQDRENSWWKKNLTIDDIDLVSSYNTYRNPGLPPTPISNPGLFALQAVVNAPKTNYLYYISDKSGRNHYAQGLDQHNANIKKYGL